MGGAPWKPPSVSLVRGGGRPWRAVPVPSWSGSWVGRAVPAGVGRAASEIRSGLGRRLLLSVPCLGFSSPRGLGRRRCPSSEAMVGRPERAGARGAPSSGGWIAWRGGPGFPRQRERCAERERTGRAPTPLHAHAGSAYCLGRRWGRSPSHEHLVGPTSSRIVWASLRSIIGLLVSPRSQKSFLCPLMRTANCDFWCPFQFPFMLHSNPVGRGELGRNWEEGNWEGTGRRGREELRRGEGWTEGRK